MTDSGKFTCRDINDFDRFHLEWRKDYSVIFSASNEIPTLFPCVIVYWVEQVDNGPNQLHTEIVNLTDFQSV